MKPIRRKPPARKASLIARKFGAPDEILEPLFLSAFIFSDKAKGPDCRARAKEGVVEAKNPLKIPLNPFLKLEYPPH